MVSTVACLAALAAWSSARATAEPMVRIAETRFTMGTNDARARPAERPERVVTAGPFWIDRTEVTVGAYRACVSRGACARPAKTSTACTYDLGDPELPVSCVGWSAALAFCVAHGKRLPREAEWELAARGTSPAAYPWGGGYTGCGHAITLVKEGTQKSCGKTGPLRVGSRPAGASPFGLLDMSGNLEEWTLDWFGDLANGERTPAAGASHVLRGGGWLSAPSEARVTSRSWGSVVEAGPNVGFRCARDDAP